MRQGTFTCPSGATLITSELGFGGAPLGNLFTAIPEEVAEQTLAATWDAGMRLYDTAPLYGLGLSEARVGGFLSQKPRDSFTLSTKAGRVLEDCPPAEATPDKFVDTPSRRIVYDYSYDGVMRSFEQSLDRLGLDRIDILLCHDVDIFTHGTKEASDARAAEFLAGGYRAFVKLRDEGTVRAIGAGLNEWQISEHLARQGDFDLFLLAGRYTLLEQEALESFLPLCAERGIGILLGGAYNSGILATGAVVGAVYNYTPAPAEIRVRVDAIEQICTAHNVPLAAAALQFPLAHPQVISVIPGVRSPDEVARAMATFAHPIPAALWSDLREAGLLRADAPVPGGAS
ncbi:MAG: aldo/keto reductase [Pseudomonadota bacterium]